MNKKILLLAYMNINFGDDMFVKTICNFFPEEEFVIEAPAKYQEIYSDVGNLNILADIPINRFNKKLNRALSKTKLNRLHPIRDIMFKKYKAIVYVIGGLFDEDDIWYDNIKKFGLDVMKEKMWRYSLNSYTPFYLLGCNMTRINTEAYKTQMTYLFTGITDICFRDRFSYEHFSNLKNVRYAPDIVFNFNCNENRTRKNNVVISVWGALTQCEKLPQWKWAEKYWDRYKKLICESIKYFQNISMSICLLALCKDEGDLEGCQQIYDNCDIKDNIDIELYDGNLNETISIFETAGFILGSRFHSVIMALNSKTPFFSIAYENKTIQLLKDIGYQAPSAYIETIDNHTLNDIDYVFKRREITNVEYLKKEAKNQFKVLKKNLEVLYDEEQV